MFIFFQLCSYSSQCFFFSTVFTYFIIITVLHCFFNCVHIFHIHHSASLFFQLCSHISYSSQCLFFFPTVFTYFIIITVLHFCFQLCSHISYSSQCFFFSTVFTYFIFITVLIFFQLCSHISYSSQCFFFFELCSHISNDLIIKLLIYYIRSFFFSTVFTYFKSSHNHYSIYYIRSFFFSTVFTYSIVF